MKKAFVIGGLMLAAMLWANGGYVAACAVYVVLAAATVGIREA